MALPVPSPRPSPFDWISPLQAIREELQVRLSAQRDSHCQDKLRRQLITIEELLSDFLVETYDANAQRDDPAEVSRSISDQLRTRRVFALCQAAAQLRERAQQVSRENSTLRLALLEQMQIFDGMQEELRKSGRLAEARDAAARRSASPTPQAH